MAKKQKSNAKITKLITKNRPYISQSDVPGYSLEQAMKVPQAITEHYASDPVSPLLLASALNMSPSSSSFRQLCGASIAYGLSEGGYNAQQISLTTISKRIFKSRIEGDDSVAKREATLRPRVIGEFLKKYNNSSLPRHDIALNVLEEMGVPSNKTKDVYKMITESAQYVGFLREIKGKQYVDLAGVDQPSAEPEAESNENPQDISQEDDAEISKEVKTQNAIPISSTGTNRKVFITHGKNKDFIEPIKKLLGFGELIPIVSVEKQSVSEPVPDKVMGDMRSCGAAIIHVTDEVKMTDKDAKEHVIINPNVLIEIGAAIALYGRRFILLVKEGVTLPSNLLGLYEVRYKEDTLDGNTTIKLLEAINDIKNHPMPDRYKQTDS